MKLNKLTVDAKYPLHNISDLLDQLDECQYIPILYLASGFHQIETLRTYKRVWRMDIWIFRIFFECYRMRHRPFKGLITTQTEDGMYIFSNLQKLSSENGHHKIHHDKCAFLGIEFAYLGRT